MKNEINKVISKSKKLELWEHIYHVENEIKEKLIELEKAVRKEVKLKGFVFKGITILNILLEIKNQLAELEKVAYTKKRFRKE